MLDILLFHREFFLCIFGTKQGLSRFVSIRLTENILNTIIITESEMFGGHEGDANEIGPNE